MPITAIIFDMDETLVVDDAATDEAILATCEQAAPKYGVAAGALARAVLRQARELWRASPVHGYGSALGISSREVLWGRFLGDDSNLTALRAWMAGFRMQAWSKALISLSVAKETGIEEWVERFPQERRVRHRVFPDAEPCLKELKQRYRLALLSNGAADLQREKLEASGLTGYFEAVVISGEVGIGKPDPAISRLAAEQVGATPATAVMVGDSLQRDVVGAQRAGMRAVWLNRDGAPMPEGVHPDAAVRGLGELAGVVEQW